MSSYPARRRGPAWAGVAIVITVLALALRTSPALAGTYATLSGSGSSWASVALVQWANDLAPNGLTVNFLADGSASGRGDYMQGSQVDFAASDPPFRNGKDELGGTGAEHPSYGYSYVPDVGGGTAFMYHVTVGGHLVTNLRLSGETLMKIFTGQITNWDNPEITKDYGAQLPNEPIIPVIRSDGSGATFFLTRWMSHVFPNDWNAFCQRGPPGDPAAVPADRVLPAVRQREGRERVQRRLGLRHLQLRRGGHRLRRVRLRAERALAGRGDGEPGRLLRAPHRVQRGGRPDPGADRREPAAAPTSCSRTWTACTRTRTRAAIRCPATAT